MNIQPLKSEWVRLSGGYDVEFRHGIPFRVSDNGRSNPVSNPELIDEIRTIAGLDVRVGEWQAGEDENERVATLTITPAQLDEVLRRLARSSAALFVERFHKPIDQGDMDWDRLEYAEDFKLAVHLCGLEPGQVDRQEFLDRYVDVMHRESEILTEAIEPPVVRAE